MDPKSSVVKSKSSNSCISKKSREERKTQADKTSRSSADFPHYGIKKRGVYVEKRATRVNLVPGKKDDAIFKKAPSRPRPGQKKFLASVLSILSKSTTGTQCPEAVDNSTRDSKQKKYINDKNRASLKRVNVKREESGVKTDSARNKEKFKSKVLNNKSVRDDKKKMVVLQSKKDIVQTPSNYSEWSYRDASQKSNTSNILPKDKESKGRADGSERVADDLKNAILEGRSERSVKKSRYHKDDPKTLVADEPKVQKRLYNFFVDLLETTISVYNVQAEYNAPNPNDVSNTELHIDELVANKLYINKEAGKALNVTPDGNIAHQHNNMDNRFSTEDYVNAKPITIQPSKHDVRLKTRKSKLKKMKAASFIQTNRLVFATNANKARMPQTSKSFEMSRRTKFKNKDDLINDLKQELKMHADVAEAPKSIFQALKVMARNKKRISFSPKTFTDECVLMRRKILETGKAKRNRKRTTQNPFKLAKPVQNRTDYKYGNKKHYTDTPKRNESDTDSVESTLSLEVYGLEKDSKDHTSTGLNKTKGVTFTLHSSNSDLDYDVTEALLNPSPDSITRM